MVKKGLFGAKNAKQQRRGSGCADSLLALWGQRIGHAVRGRKEGFGMSIPLIFDKSLSRRQGVRPPKGGLPPWLESSRDRGEETKNNLVKNNLDLSENYRIKHPP